jgi:Polyketide cyclase / dehydrase and lipid transport
MCCTAAAADGIGETVRVDSLSYSDSIIVDGTPSDLYEMVADITRMGEWSPICTLCRWEDDTRGEGAWFVGHNEVPGRTWETRSQVVAAEPGREFAFLVGGGLVRWGYRFDKVAEGTRLTEDWEFLPAGLAAFEERYGADAPAQVAERTRAARTGIPATLAAIKKAAESG